MLYLIGNYFNCLNFFKSIYLRSAIAFIVSFFIVIIIGKPFINFLIRKKFGETIRDDGPKTHANKKGTPTMGGVLIVFSILFTSFLIADISNKFILLLFCITFLFSCIGFIDDYKKFTENKRGLSGKKKLMGQAIISIIVWIFIFSSNLTGNKEIDLSIINPFNGEKLLYLGLVGMLILIILILTGTSNAVNLTDGLDGLVIMPTVIATAIFASIAYFSGHIEISSHLNLFYIKESGEITVFLLSLCGAGLGFLWYNFYPAQIFMGDTGSLTLGGILGVSAILLKQEFLLPIIGFVFVLEAISVILQVLYFKITHGKRIFKMAPLHHHFELSGMMETKVTVRFWITSLIFGIIALSIIRMRGLI